MPTVVPTVPPTSDRSTAAVADTATQFRRTNFRTRYHPPVGAADTGKFDSSGKDAGGWWFNLEEGDDDD